SVLSLVAEREDCRVCRLARRVNRPLTMQWASIAGGNFPPQLCTQAPAVVPASGLLTFVLSSRPRRGGNGGAPMIPKSGHRFSEKIMRRVKVEHERYHRR